MWWVVTHLCLAGLFSSSFCKKLFSFKGSPGSPALPALWKWLCHSSYAVPAVCAPVIDGSSRSIVTLLFLSMGILSGAPGLLSHWHLHKPITSFMLQVLSFEAAAPLFSLPQYSCFVHLWCCISKWVALSGLSCYHTTKKWNKRALPISKSVLMISLMCFISDLGYYKFIYKILPACLMLGLGKQEIHSQFLVWTLDTGQHDLMQ